MGGILIFLAALAAFALGGAIVLLISVYRRSEQHRGALLQAYARIDQLERMMAAITFGETPQIAPLRKVGSAAAVEGPAEATPLPAPEPAAALTAQPAEQPATPPAVEAPAPAAEPAAAARASEEEESVAARISRVDAEAPFRLDIIAALTGLAALAALGATRAGVMEANVGLTIAGIAGAAAIGFAERRRGDGFAAELLWMFGGALIAAGFITARFTAGGPAALALLVGAGALSLGALARAQVFGRSLAAFGVVCGLLAPALMLSGDYAAHARHGVLLAACGAALWTARVRGEPRWGHVMLAGALMWGGYSAYAAARTPDAISVSAYLTVLSALMLAHAWFQARAPLRPIGNPRRRLALMAALLGISGGAVLLALLATRADAYAQAACAALGAIILMSSAGAALRQGLAPLPLFVAIMAALALRFWPEGVSDMRWFGVSAGGLALSAAIGGALMLWRKHDEGAAMAGLAPLAMLVAAQAHAPDAIAPWMWASAAAAIAVISPLCAFASHRAMPLARDLFVMGGALALVAALGFLTPAPWPPLVVALAVPLAAALCLRLRQPGLGLAACALAAFLLLQLLAPQLAAASAAMRVLVYLIAAASLFAAAQILSPRNATPESQALLAATLLSVACALTVEAHRAFVAAQPAYQLLELGVHVLLWLGLALALALRFGAKTSALIYAIEAASFAAAAVYALAAGVFVLNPWWGVSAAPAPGWAGLNLLLLAYLGPAALFVLYGRLRELQGLKLRAAIAIGIGLTLALLHVTLELRRTFHGAEMAAGPVLAPEGWAYTIGWLGFAAALVLLSMERTSAWLRHAAVAIALAALAKAMVFDLQSFSGLAQMAMLALLLGAAVGVVLLYRRFVLPARAATPKTAAQPPVAQAPEPS